LSIIITDMYTKRLEASVAYSILTQLNNLGWVVNETNPECNVFQQRTKTEEQRKLLKGKFPDFLLYQSGTNYPIAVIEAKRPDKTLTNVLDETEEKYATPLDTPLIFAYNDSFIATRHLHKKRPLKIDGEDVRQFVNQYTALRFVHEGPEILSAPPQLQYSIEQLIYIFKEASDLLREAGLQAGLERFGAFSDILFLKIMDEVCELKLHAGEKPPLPDIIRWSHFKGMDARQRHDYLKNFVWKEMNKYYKDIFSETMPIDSPEILDEIVRKLSKLNLLSADTDVKGDAFEYFLKNAYQGVNIKDLGEYFTPRNIVRTMVSMVAPRIGEKIYDPFCGTGGFLIESYRYLHLRVKPEPDLENQLKYRTVFGSEITTNARIAKMNMILFGDGHSNVEKEDSLANPKRGKYDIVLTNPPYSQTTRYGNLYTTNPKNGDAVCAMHCFDALNNGGRLAMLVKEDFLSGGGDVGRVRDYIFDNAKNFSVVSLPRKLFIPYTPTKTNILYYEKAGKRNATFFYVIKNVGHTLTTRRKNIPQNDLPKMLDAFKSEKPSLEIESYIIDNAIIQENKNSLWVYDYFEVLPESQYPMEYLGDYIEPSGQITVLKDYPDQEFIILGVNNRQGIVETDVKLGDDVKQKYQKVSTGDIVYNPHRFNVGSIGLVMEEYDGGYVPSIYVVFKATKPNKVPANYIVWLLKSDLYKQVIEAYDTKHGAVRANMTYDQLCRVRIPIVGDDKMATFKTKQGEIDSLRKDIRNREKQLASHLKSITSDKPKLHSQAIKKPVDFGITQAEFHDILKRASKPIKPESGSGQP
jgi:type I restriction enzyme M protein